MPPLGRILARTGFLGLTCCLPLTYREGMVEFGILGPLEITAGGQPLPVQGARIRTVLAMLLVHANQVVPADRLTGELWAGQPAGGAAASLQVRVSQLRKALRPSGEAGRLVTRPPGYLIRVAPDELDAPRFERLARDGETALAAGDDALAVRRLDEALGLWRGPALADVDDAPFARAEAARLEERRLAAVESRAEALLACGRHRELIGELETLTAAHPLRERLWSHRMLALYRAGRQAEALRAYRDLREILTGELGIEPSPALRELEGRILRQDAALAPPAAGGGRDGGPGPAAGPGRPERGGTAGHPVRAERRRRAHRLPGPRPGRPGHRDRSRPDQPPRPVVGGPVRGAVLPAAGLARPADHVRQARYRAVRPGGRGGHGRAAHRRRARGDAGVRFGPGRAVRLLRGRPDEHLVRRQVPRAGHRADPRRGLGPVAGRAGLPVRAADGRDGQRHRGAGGPPLGAGRQH